MGAPRARVIATAAAVGFAVLAPGLGAQAAPAGMKSAVVVQVVNRSPVGNMLATTGGASLYIHPSGPCTGSCLGVWPALLMPAGKTKPKGVECLVDGVHPGRTPGHLQQQGPLHLHG